MERRGIDVGLESVDESGVVRFPIGPTVSPAQRLEDLVGQLKTHYGANPVILVDEYDAPLVHLLGKDAGPNRSWTSCATSTSSSRGSSTIYNFVFVTSNTRFARVSLFSAFNNLWDISWEPAYATLCVFTEQEVRTDCILTSPLARPTSTCPLRN